MSPLARIAAASFFAGVAIHIAAGPRPVKVYSPNLPPGEKRLHLVHGVGQVEVDDLEPFDASDVVDAHVTCCGGQLDKAAADA